MTYYARQIFDETKLYEFRKSPLRDELLNKKIYVYSAKEDKAIIGYFKVSDILNENTDEILRDMRSISKNADMPQCIKFIYDNDPLYEVIKEWDEAFSLDGNLCDNPSKTKQMILQKARMKGKK